MNRAGCELVTLYISGADGMVRYGLHDKFIAAVKQLCDLGTMFGLLQYVSAPQRLILECRWLGLNGGKWVGVPGMESRACY